jgi:poly(3-hydroxybutyrate) depolymerase
MRSIICASLVLAACSTNPDPAVEPDAPPVECAQTGELHGQTLANGDGVEDRVYWLYVPHAYDCSALMPLLVDFHGTASDQPEEAYQTEALIAFAEQRNVIVARPRSRSSTFNGVEIYRWDQNAGDLPRNVKLGKALVVELERRYKIDPARVYASGFSSGSNMVAQFLADAQSPFQGIAPIAGGNWSPLTLPSLVNGPRVYMATGYRDYLWPYVPRQLTAMSNAGLPADRVEVRRTGGGHDLYAWHFDELWEFLDGDVQHGGGTLAAPWTATTLPSPADVNTIADDHGTLVAAGAHGRTWRRGATGWTLDLDRGDADYTTLCFGATGRNFVGGSSVAVLGSSGAWGASGSVPDFGGMLGAGWINSATCRDDGSIVVVGYWSGARSTNGTTWTRFPLPTQYPGVEAQLAGIATAPGGATIAVGYYDYVGRAPAGGLIDAPTPHPAQAEWWNAVAATAQAIWIVGDDGRVMKSIDDGRTWTSQQSGTQDNLYAISFADAQHGAAVGRRGTVIVTADGGAHWSPRSFGRDVYLGAVHVDASTIWIGGEDGLIASSPR